MFYYLLFVFLVLKNQFVLHEQRTLYCSINNQNIFQYFYLYK